MEHSHLRALVEDGVYTIIYFQLHDVAQQLHYVYLAVKLGDIRAFDAACRAGGFNPEEFGTVLAAGEGDPPPHVKDYMEEEFGFQHDSPLTVSIDNEAADHAG